MIYCTYMSAVGEMILASNGTSLVGAWFHGQKYFPCIDGWSRGENEILLKAAQWLNCYFAGQEPQMDIPLAPWGTDFQQSVWALLQQIPYGETVTYGTLSALLRMSGIKACPQAVGGAVGRNPISIFVPCHRVLGANGGLTGYAGGVDRKSYLLNLESK